MSCYLATIKTDSFGTIAETHGGTLDLGEKALKPNTEYHLYAEQEEESKINKVTVELPEIEGYEDTGEFRQPKPGELFRDSLSLHLHEVVHADSEIPNGKRFILKKKRWRAKNGECYYYIDSSIDTALETELGTAGDDARWRAGNYFKHEQTARNYRDVVQEVIEPIRNGEEE